MIIIPKNLTGKELIGFLMANKTEIINQKCAFPRKSDENNYPYSITKKSKIASNKAESSQSVVNEKGELDIQAVGNAANWIDSQVDMLLPDCWKKTIKELGPSGKKRIHHLHDHEQDTTGVVGIVKDLYSQDYSLNDLGLSMAGSTQCLVMDSIVKEVYNERCYNQYLDKIINQHSIGLQYVKLDIAVNDPNYPSEFSVWNKYYAQVINKDVANKLGYFWVVYEIKLLEISAVLWGSNELTGCPSNEDSEEKEVEIIEPKTKSISVSEMISNAKIKIAL